MAAIIDPERLREIEKYLALLNPKPSEVIEVPYIHARRKRESSETDTSRRGKWLLYVPTKDVDEIWRKVKKATEDGKLGPSSKVSTAMPNPHRRNADTRAIFVYTHDHENEKDVMRVRQELREMGFTNKIAYKTDADTLAGKYKTTTRERVSKYYC